MTHENYRLIRNIMNDCYNVFYAKWAQKALKEPLSDKDWLLISDEARAIGKKYETTTCFPLAKNLLIDLIEMLDKM